MRAIGFFSRRFTRDFWTTYRVPFGLPTITYPDRVKDPLRRPGTLDHELIHCQQFRPWYGPIWIALLAAVLPLPIIFSGRWFIERPAYLADIKAGRLTVDRAVEILWTGYVAPWPPALMRRWFRSRLD